jgi:hypothetical protein
VLVAVQCCGGGFLRFLMRIVLVEEGKVRMRFGEGNFCFLLRRARGLGSPVEESPDGAWTHVGKLRLTTVHQAP